MSRNRKMALIASMLLVAGGLAYLALGNFGQNIVYFFTPSEIIALSPDRDDRKVRVGGMVVAGTLRAIPNTLKIQFDLTDGAATIPIRFEGMPPGLLKEGQGAVVEGTWDRKMFHSNMIMAKHSEDYMPIEMQQAGVQLPKKDFLKTLQQ